MRFAAIADTHALIWFLWGDPRMSRVAGAIFDDAAATGLLVGVSSISFVEIVYLIEKRRIDPRTLSKAYDILDLGDVLEEVEVDRDIVPALAMIPRDAVPDMPDRIIAATAAYLGVPLISRDRKIQASSVTTIW